MYFARCNFSYWEKVRVLWVQPNPTFLPTGRNRNLFFFSLPFLNLKTQAESHSVSPVWLSSS